MQQLEYLIQGKLPFLQQRSKQILQANQYGPPDLLIMDMATKSTFFYKSQNIRICYNFTGLIPKAYILAAQVKHHAQTYKPKGYQLQRSIFCFYNFYSKTDHHFQILTNGKIHLKAYDRQGKPISNSRNLIIQYQLSTLVRSLVGLNFKLGRRYDPFSQDHRLIKQAIQWCLIVQQKIQISRSFLICSNGPLSVITEYILRKHLQQTVLIMIQSIQDQSVGFILFKSFLWQIKQGIKQTFKMLMQYDINNPEIKLRLAQLLRKSSKQQQAINLLNSIIHINHWNIWYEISKCYIESGYFYQALIALNQASSKIITQDSPKHYFLRGEGKPIQRPSLQKIPQSDLNPLQLNSSGQKMKQKKVLNLIGMIAASIEKKGLKNLLSEIFEGNKIEIPLNLVVQQIKIKKQIPKNKIQIKQTKQQRLPFFFDEIRSNSVQNKLLRNLSIIGEQFTRQYQDKSTIILQQFPKSKSTINYYLTNQFKTITNYFLKLQQKQEQYLWYTKNYVQLIALLDKLQKTKFSFSIYAKILSIFLQTQNYQSLLYVLDTLCKDMTIQGIQYKRLPDWAQDYALAMKAALGKGLSCLISDKPPQLVILSALHSRPSLQQH